MLIIAAVAAATPATAAAVTGVFYCRCCCSAVSPTVIAIVATADSELVAIDLLLHMH